MKRPYSKLLKDRIAGNRVSKALLLGAAVALLHAAVNQRTFATPQEAAQAAVDAAGHDDTAALVSLFGPDGKDLVENGDSNDKNSRAEFVRLAHEKIGIEQDPSAPDKATFSVGNQDWPFPVPLIRKAGKWQFDPARGRLEIRARRIGRNELNAMEVCRGYVEAQMEYAAKDRDADGTLEYAQRIVSSPGKSDGLFGKGAPEGLVSQAFAAAAADLEKREPYHGYYFRILKAQGPDAAGGGFNYMIKGEMIGGFALVAWPAEYGVLGVQTFIVNHHGVVYEKDLGPNTAALARQITTFNPDKSWHRSEKE